MSGGAGTVGENRYNTRRSGDSTGSNVTETTASKSKKAPSCLILLGQLKLKATVSTKNKISNNAVAFEHLLCVRYFPKLFYSINTIPLVLPPHSTVWHAEFSGDQRTCPNNTQNRELGQRWDLNSDLSTSQMQTANLPGEGNGTPLQYSCLENPMDGGAWKAAVHGVAEGRTRLSDFTFTFHFPLSCIGEGNGNPLQCSCLENPRGGGAWWPAVYGVAQSQTRLKWLSSNLPGREGRVASSALTFSKQSPYLATAFRVLAWSFFLQASFSLKRIPFFMLQR